MLHGAVAATERGTCPCWTLSAIWLGESLPAMQEIRAEHSFHAFCKLALREEVANREGFHFCQLKLIFLFLFIVSPHLPIFSKLL